VNFAPLDLDTAGRILDFSGGDPELASLAEMQLEGAVSLHNIIADPDIGMGYLADEVGMGKTYVALGVVSLMRYFNPSLRVLFICPSANVQDKWYDREYRSFVKQNVRVSHFRIRTPDGHPAVPRVSCANVRELILAATAGHYADFFVRMSAFSMGLSEEESAWAARLEDLSTILPAAQQKKLAESKRDVKERYAAALNYALPVFDLVVIDEAHNFKHGFESSDRNLVLSAALGFRDTGTNQPRAKHALLLSATPYDRNLEELRNQLRLVGKGSLLPDDIDSEERDRAKFHISTFMVRRLNELTIGGRPYTRNMYRVEHREGDKAEVRHTSDEQRLVTALVQKKVGEMLDRKDGGACFETGLLASFESYAESTRSPRVEFDGETLSRTPSDAEDKHVIGAISDSYQCAGLGNTLPHPKMDAVTRRVADEMLRLGRKQLVFVRRVKSVNELKHKLDDRYNDWLFDYLRRELEGHDRALGMMNSLIGEYRVRSRRRDDDISGGEFVGHTGDADDRQAPKNDTFFTWLFRGEIEPEIALLFGSGRSTFPNPNRMRIGLVARNQAMSSLFEINWARTLCRALGEDLECLCTDHGAAIAQRAAEQTTAQVQNDQLAIFEAAQLGFILWLAERCGLRLAPLAEHLSALATGECLSGVADSRYIEALATTCLFDALHDEELGGALFPLADSIACDLVSGAGDVTAERIKTIEIHRYLVALSLRTGHGVIDLYLMRLRLGPQDLDPGRRTAWMTMFAQMMRGQCGQIRFCTYNELERLSAQLDLIIKTNLPDAYDTGYDAFRHYFAQSLNPVAPVIGASGSTLGSRSAQARKFRMPGYPLALISTDVFQEGEDLHTFCDSVIHYGLGNAAVGIEQKNGRIDRIASLAQRRLTKLDAADGVKSEDLIQVTFPFVRESIEVLQVRQLCRNLNAFLESLHEVGTGAGEAVRVIDAALELTDRSAIPPQITAPLRSPYVPKTLARSLQYSKAGTVAQAEREICKLQDEVAGQLAAYFKGENVLNREGSFRTVEGVLVSNIRLTSARSGDAVLLTAEQARSERSFAEIDLRGLSKKSLARLMAETSVNRLSRTFVEEITHRGFALHFDSELLVGRDVGAHPDVIARFFERFSDKPDPATARRPDSPVVTRHWRKAVETARNETGPWHAHIIGRERRECLSLIFRFGTGSTPRKHEIRIQECDGRVVFHSTAAGPAEVRKLSVDQIVRFTWGRNRKVDLVEFMLTPELAIEGRVVQPIAALTFESFIYCAQTLAAFTDRLEYVIQQPDVY
jgi:hypothetical protein